MFISDLRQILEQLVLLRLKKKNFYVFKTFHAQRSIPPLSAILAAICLLLQTLLKMSTMDGRLVSIQPSMFEPESDPEQENEDDGVMTWFSSTTANAVTSQPTKHYSEQRK